MSAISSATSGLTAAATRLAASAHNVATWGADAVEAVSGDLYVQPVQPVAPPKPVRVLLSSQAQGGVMAMVQEDEPSGAASSPNAPPRGSQIDLARETVQQVQAMAAFHANLSMIRTADEMDKVLLNTLA